MASNALSESEADQKIVLIRKDWIEALGCWTDWRRRSHASAAPTPEELCARRLSNIVSGVAGQPCLYRYCWDERPERAGRRA